MIREGVTLFALIFLLCDYDNPVTDTVFNFLFNLAELSHHQARDSLSRLSKEQFFDCSFTSAYFLEVLVRIYNSNIKEMLSDEDLIFFLARSANISADSEQTVYSI